jgi:transcriptional regulator with XRE-family HTH domain
METLGQRLKHVRNDLSQQAIADKLGIPQSTWNNYESGRNQPDLALLDKICVHFGIKTDWLLFGRGPMREEAQVSPGQATEYNNQLLESRVAALEKGFAEKLVYSQEREIALLREINELKNAYRELQYKNKELIEQLSLSALPDEKSA